MRRRVPTNCPRTLGLGTDPRKPSLLNASLAKPGTCLRGPKGYLGSRHKAGNPSRLRTLSKGLDDEVKWAILST